MGVDFSRPGGKLVVDIGAGVTDIAVLSAGGVVQCESAPIGSIDYDDAIIKYVRKEFNVLIGDLTAEEIKMQIGSAIPRREEVTISAKGRNLFTGLPQIFEISSGDVYSAMCDISYSICGEIKKVLERTEPDLVADIMGDKINVSGGGANLNGMGELLKEFFECDVHIHHDAEHSVVKGAYAALKRPELLKNIDFDMRNIQDLIVE
jgi:rod shape-determining protein MreB